MTDYRDTYIPKYLHTLKKGEFSAKIERSKSMLKECSVCARGCGVDRMSGERGTCRTGSLALVSSFNPHYGEERPLSGIRGSGTIFFTNCNLRCVYCQNYDISQLGKGMEISLQKLAEIMLTLQAYGCHNINLVTPSHVVPQIIESISIAAQNGLSIPIVYNTSSYDSLTSLKLLDGIVDIYLADLRYTDNETAKRYSSAPNYVEVSKAAIKEMFRQVEDLLTDEHGVAQKGLMIRHLVLPNDLAGTEEAMRFIAEEVSPNTFVNLMSQYRPTYLTGEYPLLNRGINRAEFDRARKIRERYSLFKGEVQSLWGW